MKIYVSSTQLPNCKLKSGEVIQFLDNGDSQITVVGTTFKFRTDEKYVNLDRVKEGLPPESFKEFIEEVLVTHLFRANELLTLGVVKNINGLYVPTPTLSYEHVQDDKEWIEVVALGEECEKVRAIHPRGTVLLIHGFHWIVTETVNEVGASKLLGFEEDNTGTLRYFRNSFLNTLKSKEDM
jgi:hypothetical protein